MLESVQKEIQVRLRLHCLIYLGYLCLNPFLSDHAANNAELSQAHQNAHP